MSVHIYVVYVVKAGDTLSAISEAFYGDMNYYRTLAEYNDITNPDLIVVGQKLKLPYVLLVESGTKGRRSKVKIVYRRGCKR